MSVQRNSGAEASQARLDVILLTNSASLALPLGDLLYELSKYGTVGTLTCLMEDEGGILVPREKVPKFAAATAAAASTNVEKPAK